MKATVDSGAFFKALNRIIPLLKVSAIPALSEASIQFRDGVCTITATDLELWIQTEIPAAGDDFGVVLSGTKSIVKAGKFFRGPLTFSCADAAVSSPQITMTCADKSAEFTGHPLKDIRSCRGLPVSRRIPPMQHSYSPALAASSMQPSGGATAAP